MKIYVKKFLKIKKKNRHRGVWVYCSYALVEGTWSRNSTMRRGDSGSGHCVLVGWGMMIDAYMRSGVRVTMLEQCKE